MEKKLNINTATEVELRKIKGVGESTAKKILDFRKSGGTFNSIEEVQKVGDVSNLYVNSLEESIVFGPGDLADKTTLDLVRVQPNIQVALDPRAPLIDFPLPIFETYSFNVNLKGSGGANLPDLKGYNLVVGYRIGEYTEPGEISYLERTISYHLGDSAKQRISIVKPMASANFIENTFNLNIKSSEGVTIYNSVFTIGEDDTVHIELPISDPRELNLKVNKANGGDYTGYLLKVGTTINRSVSGVEVVEKQFDLSNESEFLLEIDAFGEPLDLTFRVVTRDGLVLIDEVIAWGDLDGNSQSKKIVRDLPAFKSIGYKVILSETAEVIDNSYLDHVAEVSFDLLDPGTKQFVKHIIRQFQIDKSGKSEITFEYHGLIEYFNLKIKAPSGEIISRKRLEFSEATVDVEVKVPPKKLASLKDVELLPERPKKSVGRVIDLKGHRVFEDIQLVIYVAKVDNPSDKDFDALSIVTTERDGYFVLDTPKGYFTEAYAVIGVPKKGNVDGETSKVPLRLEKDQVVIQKDAGPDVMEKLFFPPNLVLVVDTDADDDETDCSCTDCGLDFHRPKKVVDEFSYYTVVRTTEPVIQGYTIKDDGEMSVRGILEVIPLEDEGNGSTNRIPLNVQNQNIKKSVLLKHINDKRGLTLTTLKKAINESNAIKLREVIKPSQDVRSIGRHELDWENEIDWDEDPTIYQAITISHGHILHFKQEWINNGYGIGDLLYSLPLAPGQKKQIVVYDWERRESASRREALDYQDSLHNSLSRDRDISEIVRGSISEQTRGGSNARTSAVGGGLGLGFIGSGFGALLGVAGGTSSANSSAWQNSTRTTALNDLQQLRDRTIQSANSVRNQRSTVITTASQGERFSVETEVVANYNHCHSLTMEYFEVMRYMLIQQRLSSVQECLFIPLIMSSFDHQKILRWREILSRYIGRKLRKGFDSIERMENDYEGSGLPKGSFAEENLDYLEGGIYIKFNIPPPVDFETLNEKAEMIEALSGISAIIPGLGRHIDRMYSAAANRRNQFFLEYIAPELATAFVENLKFEAVVESGVDGNESLVELPIDTSLISRYQNNRSHYITLRQHSDLSGISRKSIKAVNISKASDVVLNNGSRLSDSLPPNTQIIVTSGRLNYRTAYSSGALFSKSRIQDDLVGYGGIADEDEKVRIATPLSRAELRNPREEDLELANALQDHLNNELEVYHKAIWMNMNPERRFMFLDGIQVKDFSNLEDYPEGVIRSVASVVENRVIGVVGNSLVMPVCSGFRLDPNTRGKDIDLHSLYEPITPIEPINISIPTKGVYAEAIMGKCNSCELKEDDRFWRWEESPIPDSPTAIGQVGTDSRRSEPLNTTPTQFPNPMINIQNAPAAPDPTGLASAQQLLGSSSFRDITGLDQNQKNALEALKASLSTAEAFGTKAADMAALGAKLDAIKKAKENKMLSPEKAMELTEEAIKSSTLGGSGSKVSESLDDLKKVQEMKKSQEISPENADKISGGIVEKISDPDGSTEHSISDLIEKSTSLLGSGNIGSIEASMSGADGVETQFTLASNTSGANVSGIKTTDFRLLKDHARNSKVSIPATGMKLRKNASDLTPNEWNQFKTAVTAMRAEASQGGQPNRYEDWVDLHIKAAMVENNNWKVHQTMGNATFTISNFLAWHRIYLCKFEDEFIAKGGIPLPYWDWYDNSSLPSEMQLTPSELTNWGIDRNIGAGMSTMPRKANVEKVWADAMSGASWDSVQKDWEYVHNALHVFIGGNMNSAVSPRDPIFWLHHSFIDKFWSDLIAINPMLKPSNLTEVLQPTTAVNGIDFGSVTVNQLLDYKSTCNYMYAEEFSMPVVNAKGSSDVSI